MPDPAPLREVQAADLKNDAIKVDSKTISQTHPEASVTFKPFEPLDSWLKSQPLQDLKAQWLQHGVVTIQNLINEENVEIYKDIYNKLLSGEIDASRHRHDLGSNEERKSTKVENVTQIMWPSSYLKEEDIMNGPLHSRARAIGYLLMKAELEANSMSSDQNTKIDDSNMNESVEDIVKEMSSSQPLHSAFDFDMLIDKAPHSKTEVPWHQDMGYWKKAKLDFADTRAGSFWCALDRADVENGCMWFVSNDDVRNHEKSETNDPHLYDHQPVKVGHHIIHAPEVEDLVQAEKLISAPRPLQPGSATFHSGLTLHHTKGNSTDRHRRAWIVNVRPEAMVKYERDNGFDHGLTAGSTVISLIIETMPN